MAMSFHPRRRAAVFMLISAGIAVSSTQPRSARADSPAPIALQSGGGASVSSTTVSTNTSVASLPSAPVPAGAGASVPSATSVSTSTPVASLPPAPTPAAVQVGALTPAAPSIGSASVPVSAGSVADASASTAPASAGLIDVSGSVGADSAMPVMASDSTFPTASLPGVNPSSPATAAPAVDPPFGLTAGTAATPDVSGQGSSDRTSGPEASVRAADQDTPVICSQLVFRPAVAGCEALLGPITGRGLAPTGTPLLTGLAGMLLILVGWLICARSRRRGRTASQSAGVTGGQPPARAGA